MMTSSDWNTILDNIATDASREAELPEKLVKAFDGDAWKWIWTDYLDEDKAAEVVFQASPDPFDRDIQTEVFAVARRMRHHALWSARIWASYLSGEALAKPDDNEELYGFGNELREHLSEARHRAMSAARNLEGDLEARQARNRDILSQVEHLFLNRPPSP